MAAVAEMPLVADPVPTKKGRSRRALKQKTATSNEANILAGSVSEPSPLAAPPPTEDSAQKENHESLSKKNKKGRGKKAKQNQDLSLEQQLQEMQEKLQQLSLEKQQAEDMLKAKDEVLKLKEEELETRGQEQEKLQMELKKLQKLKEFKPNVLLNMQTFPILQSLKEKEQNKNEKKRKGDPARKRPTPPYALWCKDQWVEVKRANPDANFKEVSSLLGAKWKTVSAEEKKPYEERYQAEKEAYLKIVGNEKREQEAMKLLEEEKKQKTAIELLEQYMQFAQEAAEKGNNKSKKEKDPLKPKQPMSAFFLFSNERRAAMLAENKNNVKEAAKMAGEEWRNMTEAQRAPYEEMAMKNKEVYTQEMNLYKQKKEEEAANLKKKEEEMIKLQKQEALHLLKKKEKTENLIKKTKENQQKNKKQKEEKDPHKPKKPASSFLLFSKEERKRLSEERPGINNTTITALISVKWQELSEEEKQEWNNKAAAAMEAYKKELEKYNKSVPAETSSTSQ